MRGGGGGGGFEGSQKMTDLSRKVCDVTVFMRGASAKPERWDHARTGNQRQVEGSFCLTHRRRGAAFDTSFAYRQHIVCISENLKEMNSQTKAAQSDPLIARPRLVFAQQNISKIKRIK